MQNANPPFDMIEYLLKDVLANVPNDVKSLFVGARVGVFGN